MLRSLSAQRFGIPITVFLGSLTLLVAVWQWRAQAATRRISDSGYTLVSREVLYPSQGEPFLRATTTRFVSGKGGWRQIRTLFSSEGAASSDVSFRIQGVGVFRVSGSTPVFLSSADLRPYDFSEQAIRKSKSFSREDVVGGYRVLVLRSTGPSGKFDSNNYTEVWISPELHGEIVKRVSHSASATDVIEPLEIVRSEPDARLVESHLGGRVSFDEYRGKINTARNQGRNQLADKMQSVLERAMRSTARGN